MLFMPILLLLIFLNISTNSSDFIPCLSGVDRFQSLVGQYSDCGLNTNSEVFSCAEISE
jgi:hypothetical protein